MLVFSEVFKTRILDATIVESKILVVVRSIIREPRLYAISNRQPIKKYLMFLPFDSAKFGGPSWMSGRRMNTSQRRMMFLSGYSDTGFIASIGAVIEMGVLSTSLKRLRWSLPYLGNWSDCPGLPKITTRERAHAKWLIARLWAGSMGWVPREWEIRARGSEAHFDPLFFSFPKITTKNIILRCEVLAENPRKVVRPLESITVRSKTELGAGWECLRRLALWSVNPW
jgi:hypothetical protein